MRNVWWLLCVGTACAAPSASHGPTATLAPTTELAPPGGLPRDAATPPVQARVINYRETNFEIGPEAWLAQLDATVDFRSAGDRLRLDFDDISRNLDAGGRLRFELAKFDWSVLAEGSWVRMSGDAQSTAGVTRADYENATAEVALTKSIEEQLLLFVGARYQYLQVEAPGASPTALSETQQWVEPFLGGRLSVEATDWLEVSLRGDTGGFGLGSDFTWNVIGMLYFRPAEFLTIDVGYRVLDVDYERSDFAYDGQLHGALIGVGFYW